MRTAGWQTCRALGALMLLGCSGSVVGDPPDPPEELVDTPGPRRMALLTRSQYINTLSELLPETLTLPSRSQLPMDIKVDGFANVGNGTTTVTPTAIEQYEAAARDVAARLFSTCAHHSDINQPVCDWWRERRATFMSCEDGRLTEDCVKAWIGRFGRMAWRRPLSEAEINQLVELYRTVGHQFSNAWRGVEFVLVTLLQSPYMLYRIEYGEPDPDAAHWRYTGYEMASRLAFALWDRGPDDALLDAAASGALLTDDGLAEQVDRLLDDSRARDGLRRFVNDYLALDQVWATSKDTTTYPELTDTLRGFMQEELRKLFEDSVIEDKSFLDLFDTRTTYLNKDLAAFYNVPGPEEGWVQSEFPDSAQRDGWLARAAILLANSHSVRTSPTRRGLFIRQNILCQSIGSPPPDVPNTLDEETDEQPRTLRQQLEQTHAKDTVCAGCHQRMDPLGFAFENFDAIGKYRDLDHGLPVDADTELDGVAVSGAPGLGAALKDHSETAACFVRRLFRFATGRVEAKTETRSLKSLTSFFGQEGFRIKALLRQLVMSDAFRKVQAPEGSKP